MFYKIPLVLLIAITMAKKGKKDKGVGKKPKKNKKVKEPRIRPLRTYENAIEDTWWNCNFEGNQDAYCTRDELMALIENDCYAAVDEQVELEIMNDPDTCMIREGHEDHDHSDGKDCWRNFKVKSDDDKCSGSSSDPDFDPTAPCFKWKEWDDAIDVSSGDDQAAAWGHAICDMMMDEFEAIVTDDTNVNVQEMIDWYAGDSGPAGDDECWDPVYDWAAFDYEFKYLYDFSQFIKCDWLRDQEEASS